MVAQRVFVVGGSGFLGSAIVKQALARGWEVISISPSGRPFTTPAGHQPDWTRSDRIQWKSADALRPETYADSLASCSAVVHTIGILLESDYKKGAGGSGVLKGLAQGWFGDGSRNPLDEEQSKFSYEVMNRDSALSMARAFLESRSKLPIPGSSHTPAPFVYISAEDIFRPIVSSRYIKTKREAEYELARLALDSASSGSSTSSADPSAQVDASRPLIQPFFVRPGLMYHPQTRPLSTLPAALLDFSANVHARLDSKPAATAYATSPAAGPGQGSSSSSSGLPFGLKIPTPASLIRTLGPASVQPLADLLTIPPLHVDTVAKAVCAAIAGEARAGQVGTTVTAEVGPEGMSISVGEVLATADIRKLAGWKS
ncbi:hypothetical protein OC845_005957 [Tilletia horrida]|nr:hypothetical protein OC845_005957 [Tilletia horrida]